MDRLYQLLVTMETTPPSGCGLYVDGIVSVLVGRISEDRLALVRQVNCHNIPIHPSTNHFTLLIVFVYSSTVVLMLRRVAPYHWTNATSSSTKAWCPGEIKGQQQRHGTS